MPPEPFPAHSCLDVVISLSLSLYAALSPPQIISGRMLEISNAIFKKSDLDSQKWCKIISKIAIDTVMGLSLDCSSFGDAMECLKYVKVKKIPVGGNESYAAGDDNGQHQNQPKQSCGAGIPRISVHLFSLVYLCI